MPTLASGLADPDLSEAYRSRLFGPEEIAAPREAAVLVLLSLDESAALLLTERSSSLRKHAGQIAFPGGAMEVGETPERTALREAHEEVSLDPDHVTILGRLPSAQIPVSRFAVHAVVGVWSADTTLEPDPAEVDAVLLVPVEDLADPANRSTWRHASGRVGPGFEVAGVYVWGFTAYVVDAVLKAGGWARPWDVDRSAEIPPRFLR